MPSIAKCLSSRWLMWMSFLPRIIKHIKIPLLANENRQKAINLKYCHVKLTLKKKTCYVGATRFSNKHKFDTFKKER